MNRGTRGRIPGRRVKGSFARQGPALDPPAGEAAARGGDEKA